MVASAQASAIRVLYILEVWAGGNRDMDANAEPVGGLSPDRNGEERRHHPRIYEPFPVTVRGVDADGQAFTLNTVVDNFSAGGLYLRLSRRVAPGAKLFAIVRLSTSQAPEVAAARVATRGILLRVEPQPAGVWGAAVAFTRHRFL
jgi:hypothetical protein